MNVDEITSKDVLEDEVVVPPSDVDWIFNKEGEGDSDDLEKYNDDEAKAGDQSSNWEVVGVQISIRCDANVAIPSSESLPFIA